MLSQFVQAVLVGPVSVWGNRKERRSYVATTRRGGPGGALGPNARAGVAGFYSLALILWAAALWIVAGQALAMLALLPLAVQLGWQVVKLADTAPANALLLFRSNRLAGALWAAACASVGLA